MVYTWIKVIKLGEYYINNIDKVKLQITRNLNVKNDTLKYYLYD